jgi:hypothetical protein
MHLKLQDFKSVNNYNSAFFKISSQLKLCREKVIDMNMLEKKKTYTTFYASNVVLQQQYRDCNFTRYSELMSCLQVVEQNNELLVKNHQSRPTSSSHFPKANGTSFHENKENHRRGRKNYRGQRKCTHNSYKRNTLYHQKWNHIEVKQNENKNSQNKPTMNYEDKCYRCGMKGHLSRTCCMPKKYKENGI